MKVTLVIKKTAKRTDVNSQATIYARLRDGRRLDSVAQTNLSINPNLWDDKSECVKSKVVCSDELRSSINDETRKLKSFIEKEFQSSNEVIEKDWLKLTLDKYYNPKKYIPIEELIVKPTIGQLFDEFLIKHELSEVRKKNFKVIGRGLLRYELYVKFIKKEKKSFVLDIDEITSDTLRDMWDFFENEFKYFELYPTIYESIPEKRTPQPRGKNTLIDCFSRIRTFFIWCFDNKKTKNRPFDDYPIPECTYGTPYYITIDERNTLYKTNLKNHPELAIQRDIFVFQCLIGCRVGDLLQMKKSYVIRDAIEYIPIKIKNGRPITVRVPLNTTAKEILNRYQLPGDKLLPFISEQKYNIAIKEMFLAARLNRMVTLLNPTTRKEEKRPLNEIASSHIARRCFVGNLYKQVKDPNLVGALSGHKDGSKAFARYREIDEEMKKDLVNLLD